MYKNNFATFNLYVTFMEKYEKLLIKKFKIIFVLINLSYIHTHTHIHMYILYIRGQFEK